MPEAAIRLEGGVGDHLLGMRTLRFVRARYPDHEIVVYSDCAGHEPQLRIARLSPLVSRVVPVFHRHEPVWGELGALDNLRAEDLTRMRSAAVFIDAHGLSMGIPAAARLNVPIFELLRSKPELRVPEAGEREAATLLAAHPGKQFIAINFTKYDRTLLEPQRPRIAGILRRLLRHEDVVVLNLFTSRFSFPHWPGERAARRLEQAREQQAFVSSLCELDERIRPVVDLPIDTVAALLKRCRYFVGVDNGIKHLAWALEVPHLLLYPQTPSAPFVLRWMPDRHRMVRFDAPEEEVEPALARIEASLAGSGSARR